MENLDMLVQDTHRDKAMAQLSKMQGQERKSWEGKSLRDFVLLAQAP
jgi:hypothetical protein